MIDEIRKAIKLLAEKAGLATTPEEAHMYAEAILRLAEALRIALNP